MTTISSTPVAVYIYCGILITSGLLILSGQHRLLYELSLPDVAEAVVAGALNLGWNEYAYLIGKPTKRVEVFDGLPMIASASGIIVAVSALSRFSLRYRLTLLYLVFGCGIALMSLIVLIKQGAEDTWRLATTLSFLLSNILWFFYFRKITKSAY
jgi:hypothetical protein